MKLILLVLAASLATNAAILTTFVTSPALAPPGIREMFERGAKPAIGTVTANVRRSTAGGRKQDSAADLWANLHTEELPTLVARLRAAGFPPSMVRAIVDAEVERRFSGRIKDLTRTVDETPYWKPDPSYYMGNSKLFEDLNQIYRERSRVLRELLGKDSLVSWSGLDPTAAQRRQYGNLSQAKIDLVQRIADDYAEMTSQIRAAMQGITLPEDREKLALLEREKRADLAAVLTPEELADYEMRTSPVTNRLRTAFTILDSSEAEFRKLYEINRPYADVLYPTGMTFFTADLSEKRREAQKQVNEQVKAALGERRFTEYQRATNSEFQQLYRLGQRDNIAYDTLVRAFDLRAPIAESSAKIYDNKDLSHDEKRNALKELSQTARTQLLSTLGPIAGPAYVESNRWVAHLEQGGALTLMPEGTFSYRSLAIPRPTATTAAPKK